MASFLAPGIRFYQVLLYPVAKLTGMGLDAWLGKEGITYFREHELAGILKAHTESDEAEVGHIEGTGAMNFLAADDIPVSQVGSLLDDESVIIRSTEDDQVNVGNYDDFVAEVNGSSVKWMVIASDRQKPLLVLDADAFCRSAMRESQPINPLSFCQKPVVITDAAHTLGQALMELKKAPLAANKELILVWNQAERRIITGSDILDLLFKGV